MASKPITLSADRPALEIEMAGQKVRWEYDILPCKLEAERLEEKHGMREGDSVGPATLGFLNDFREYLIGQGLEHCTIDLACKFHTLIRYQFSKIHDLLFSQIEELP